MSEAEKRRRAEYKANRKKWIFIQTVIIALVSIFALTSAFTYYQINKTYYIDYTESSEVDYSVQLAPNDYYEEEWVGKDKAYVSALIKDIKANFKYALNMNASAGVQYSYSYDIEAVLRIADKYSGAVIYETVTVLVPKQICTQSGGKDLVIPQEVTVNYAEYNAKAKSFINTYGLKNADCALVLTMKVNVTGSCDEFAGEAQNTYFTSLSFPLATETSEPVVTSSVTNGETKVLACSSAVNINLNVY